LRQELTRSFGWDARESFTQHDVQELDRVLCDNLETKMKGTPGENALKWLFCGKMRNYIRCCNVDYKSERIEVFYDLSLNVKGIPNIIGSFRQYVEAEKMQGDNKYKPNDELGYQDADRGTEFAEFPAVLHLHLKRFEYDWERDCMAKINDRYEFFETIDLSEFCPVKEGAEPGPPNVYKLHSVMVHSGDVFGGHYYAYIRPKCTGDEWFKFDDDRVSVATPDQAIDSNFGVTPSQATVGFKRCSNAYMLVYVREADLPVVCKDVPLESVPLALRQRFDAEQALDQQKQKKKLEERFNVSVNYCIEDDLKGILGKGLLPDDHRFRSLVIRKSATVAALRTEFASSLKCDPSEVVLLNYRSHAAAKHATSVRHQFDKSYDNNDEPVFRLLDREKGNQWDPMIVYACRQRDVANTKFGIKHVVVIKVYDVATSTSKFLGLLNLNTSTFNEIAANVRELLDASGEEPYLPNFRLFLEPAFIRDDAEELTAGSQGLQTPLSPGSVIVAEVMKQETPSYVPGEFMQHYRNVDNMVTLELRHTSSPGEDVHPTFKHKCLRTELCQDIVEMIAQRYGLNASHVRLLQHDFAFNVPKRNFGFSLGGRAVELMFEFNRKLLKEHVLHFEVLTFDVAELQTKKPMKVFICTPSVNEHVTDLLPLEWTAAQICQHYQEKYPSLAAENLRVLLVGGNRLTEQLSGFNRILDKASIDDIRIEVVPPSHTELPPCSGLVPVQLFNKNAGSYLLSSLIPHPFYIRVDPGCTASAILREISTGLWLLLRSSSCC
jgi:ubiquitin carboxyl-terminal hydrolase 7